MQMDESSSESEKQKRSRGRPRKRASLEGDLKVRVEGKELAYTPWRCIETHDTGKGHTNTTDCY